MHSNINHPYPLQIFLFGNDLELGIEISNLLETIPSKHKIKVFPDGEKIPHQTETVRDRDVYIILTSQNGPEGDKWFMDYLRFCKSIKDGEPHKITVILPKLPHQRQDIENRQIRQPKLSSLFPLLFKSVGVEKILVVKLHNPASTSDLLPMDNVGTTKIIVEEIRNKFKDDLAKIVVASTDMGGAGYARHIASKLSVPIIITDKNRNVHHGETKVMNIYKEGDVSDREIIIFVDDLIATFGSLKKAADAVSEEFPNFKSFVAIATHADFTAEAPENIKTSLFKDVWVTNSVPLSESFKNDMGPEIVKIQIISIAKILAQAIDNLHNSKSVSAIWED